VAIERHGREYYGPPTGSRLRHFPSHLRFVRNASVLVFVTAAALLTVHVAALSGQSRVSEQELRNRLQSYARPAASIRERAKRGSDFVELVKEEQNRKLFVKVLDQEKDPSKKESLIRIYANTLGSAELSSYDWAAVQSVLLILLERTKSGQAALLLADKLFSLTIAQAYVAPSTLEADELAGELIVEIEKVTSGEAAEKAMTILAQDALKARNENRDLFPNLTRFTGTLSFLARSRAQREPINFVPAQNEAAPNAPAARVRQKLIRAVVAGVLLTALLTGLGILAAIIQPAIIKRFLSKIYRSAEALLLDKG
jgi:hypothetical protein